MRTWGNSRNRGSRMLDCEEELPAQIPWGTITSTTYRFLRRVQQQLLPANIATPIPTNSLTNRASTFLPHSIALSVPPHLLLHMAVSVDPVRCLRLREAHAAPVDSRNGSRRRLSILPVQPSRHLSSSSRGGSCSGGIGLSSCRLGPLPLGLDAPGRNTLCPRASQGDESANSNSTSNSSNSSTTTTTTTTSTSTTNTGNPRSVRAGLAFDSDEDVSAIMDGVPFSVLCDEFECVSSPAVERTARLLARDIHDMREDKRNISCFATNVKYSDPLRSFTGRQQYRRPSWLHVALLRPYVTMLSMEMQSTSQLTIRWRLRGEFQLPSAITLGARLDLIVISTYSLNQISGQVVEQRDEWDLSRSQPQAQLLFYTSRLAWSTVQVSKDLSEGVARIGAAIGGGRRSDSSSAIYPDPSDPRKFFTQEDPNRELYQFALLIALLYLLVQFLQLIL